MHSALGADLGTANQALRTGVGPHAASFTLHELQEPRPYLSVPGGESRDEHFDRLLRETLGEAPTALDDCLLIVASTSLDIDELEALAERSGGFHPDHSTSLDLIAEQLRDRWGFAAAFTLNTACTSAANGLLYGARMLGAALYRRVLVLTFETPSAIAQQGFGALGLVSPSGDYRPFHPQRDGLVLGEAYAAALLSPQPGPAPLARLLGGFSACDTSSLTNTREDGSHIEWVMREALRSAGVSAEQIGLVKPHGTATGANDRAESNGVRLLFGEALPPLCVLKPWLGHTLGACGLTETLLLVENLGHLPACDYAAEALLPLPAKALSIGEDSLLLANFFGFGGNNASLVLQRCTGDAP
nr:beta-ketoacyl synthase N-terminal-like domain-containing protein [Pseudomonas sp.]